MHSTLHHPERHASGPHLIKWSLKFPFTSTGKAWKYHYKTINQAPTYNTLFYRVFIIMQNLPDKKYSWWEVNPIAICAVVHKWWWSGEKSSRTGSRSCGVQREDSSWLLQERASSATGLCGRHLAPTAWTLRTGGGRFSPPLNEPAHQFQDPFLLSRPSKWRKIVTIR